MTSKTVVITRSREGNEELSSRLRRSGLAPIAVDTISFGPPRDWSRVNGLLARLGSFDWLVFTSATGARFFGDRMKDLGLKVPWEGRPTVAAVGPRTSSQLSRIGLAPRFIPSSYLTRALADGLPFRDGHRVLLLRADIADKSLPERLRERGFGVEEAAIYITTTPLSRPDSELSGARLIVFASPSAVRGLCSRLPENLLDRMREAKAVCIGPVTEAAARKNGFLDTVTPGSFTLDAVVDEVVRLSHED